MHPTNARSTSGQRSTQTRTSSALACTARLGCHPSPPCTSLPHTARMTPHFSQQTAGQRRGPPRNSVRIHRARCAQCRVILVLVRPVITGGAHGSVVAGPSEWAEALEQARGGHGTRGSGWAAQARGAPIEGVVLARSAGQAVPPREVVTLEALAVRDRLAPRIAIGKHWASGAHVGVDLVPVCPRRTDHTHTLRGRKVSRGAITKTPVAGTNRAGAPQRTGRALRIPGALLPQTGSAELTGHVRGTRIARLAVAVQGCGAGKRTLKDQPGASRAGGIPNRVLVIPGLTPPAAVGPGPTIPRDAHTVGH
eukprot:196878-Hanusia_phi.AAC.5